MVFDGLVILIILGLTIAGIARGFTKEVINLLGNITAIFLSFNYYRVLYHQLQDIFERFPVLGKLFCFVAIYLFVLFVFFVLSVSIRSLLKITHLTFIDRILGGIFGFIKGVLISTVIFMLLVTFYPPSEKKLKNCITYPLVKGMSETIAELTPKEFRHKFFNRTYLERK